MSRINAFNPCRTIQFTCRIVFSIVIICYMFLIKTRSHLRKVVTWVVKVFLQHFAQVAFILRMEENTNETNILRPFRQVDARSHLLMPSVLLEFPLRGHIANEIRDFFVVFTFLPLENLFDIYCAWSKLLWRHKDKFMSVQSGCIWMFVVAHTQEACSKWGENCELPLRQYSRLASIM